MKIFLIIAFVILFCGCMSKPIYYKNGMVYDGKYWDKLILPNGEVIYINND